MKTITHSPTDGIYAPVGEYVHALTALMRLSGIEA